MRKLKHIINWTIWSLLALYVTVVVLLQLPFVQHRLGSAVADALGRTLNAEVSVGRINLGFLNRLTIDDVLIRDQRQAELLSARRMSVKLQLLPLLNGSVSVSSAQLFGAHARLYRDSAQAVPNYQFVLDALSSPDSDKPSALNLHIGSLIVRRLSLDYDQLDAPQTPGRLNPHHLHIADVSAHVLLRALTPDTLNVNVKRVSLHEQAGLDLRQLAFKLEGNHQEAVLSDFLLQMPHTILALDSLHAHYSPDSLATSLRLSRSSIGGAIALADFASVLPLQTLTKYHFDINADFSSVPGILYCHQLSIMAPDESIMLQASGHLGKDGWQVAFSPMQVSDRLLADIQAAIPSAPQLITRLGQVSLSGQVSQDGYGHLATEGGLHCGVGHLSWQGSLEQDDKAWEAQITADSLNMHHLLDNPLFGFLTARLQLAGRQSAISIQGDVPYIDLNGYGYRDIALDGNYSPSEISGRLRIDDPHLQANVEGEFSKPRKPHVRLTGNIGSIAPQALHLSDRWGDATFAAIVDADFAASSLADAEGILNLDDFIMAQGDTTHYHLNNLHLKSGYANEGRHFLSLKSDFGEVLLEGIFNWSTLPHSLAAIVPMLATDSRPGDNDFVLSIQLTDSDWMQKLLGIGLDLEGPLNLQASVDDPHHVIQLEADVPSFSFGGDSYRNAELRLITQADSTRCVAEAVRLSDNKNDMTIRLNANVADEQLASSLTFSTRSNEGGTINTITQFYKNDEGARETHVRVLPSELKVRGMRWELEPCDIIYSDKRLMVDQFKLHHGDEHLIIDGIASTDSGDSLVLDLLGIDVASLLDVVNFHSVDFGGKASGKAYVCHAFDTPQAWADIVVKDFLFQDALMGTLGAHAAWNTDKGQIDINGIIDGQAGAKTFIDGYVSPVRSELDLGIVAQGTSIGFVHSFTSSFVKSIEGQAIGHVRIFGPLSNIDIIGEAAVTGTAAIAPLGTTYHINNDTVRLTPGNIGFKDFHVYDRDNNMALFNGAVTHHYLKNFSFDFKATASNVLAYDFPDMEAEGLIGGSVRANGEVTIASQPEGIEINCDVTPAPGSFFVYNAASPDAINQQKFITWGNKAASGKPEKQELWNGELGVQGEQKAHTSDLRINMRINATPESTLRLLMDLRSDDRIILNGAGVLTAKYYNKGPFQMFGTYNVDHGTYSMTIQNIIKKVFQFQPNSTLTFQGDPMQAVLNLQALHTVTGVSLSDLGLGNSFSSNTIRVNCLMNIGGTAGDPRVDFDLEMPTVNSEEQQMIRSIMTREQELNQQVVYLLGIGRFYTQGSNNATSQTYGQTELAMQSLLSGTVSSQINQILSQVIKNDDWNFGANISTGNEGWHNAEYEGQVSGRMLNNRLLINGQFGYRDNATQASPSFIGDFDIRYLLTPSGSMALKAYNQTNDRYFTHSSLNTQGVGIILKKDFNGMGDLFSHRRKKE